LGIFSVIVSLPKVKESLLTAKEMERLQDSKLDPKVRVRNDMIIRKKLNKWLSESTDIQRVLNFIPRKHIKKMAAEDLIFKLLEIVKKLLLYSDIGPIEGSPENAVVKKDMIQNNKRLTELGVDDTSKVCYSENRPATTRDFENILRLEKELAQIKREYIADSLAYIQFKKDKFKRDLESELNKELNDQEVNEILFESINKESPLPGWDDLFSYYELIIKPNTKAFKARNAGFLQPSGVMPLERGMMDALRKGGVWSDRDLLKELKVAPNDADAIKLIVIQLQHLQICGLVQETAKGWKWIPR
jgi:hypothetical protein